MSDIRLKMWAEARITEEMASYISGEFKIMNIDPAPFAEIFFADNDTADMWYKAKLQFITIDEKEKRSAVVYLINAGSFNGAVKSVEEVRGGTMIDYVTAKVEETPIMDVFEYAKKEKPEEADDDDL